LILAIEIGLILSSFIFMKRMSEATTVDNRKNLLETPEFEERKTFEEELAYIPKGIMLYEINGPMFFAASQKFQDILSDLREEPKVLILRMRHVPFIDATGVTRLKEFYEKLHGAGTKIIISGAQREVKEELYNAGLYTLIGKENILNNIDDALIRAEELLKSDS